jgi:hypothetical protein
MAVMSHVRGARLAVEIQFNPFGGIIMGGGALDHTGTTVTVRWLTKAWA